MYDGNKSELILSVIDKTRNTAWIEMISTGARVALCRVIMGEINIEGILENATLIDIEKLERDGWKWRQ
jgi:hypothetical protein